MIRPSAGRAFVPLSFAVLALALACSSSRPWKVTPENERRFGQATDACMKLTDTPDGFEKCMKRRGFRREYPFGF